VGIDADQIEQIFQPFEQIGELNQKSEGTGLGLSLSQKIVKMMGGEIQAISEPGVGSIFWFDLDVPLVQSGSESQLGISTHQGQVTGYQGYTRCLLVVDPQPETRTAIADLLQPLGFDIIEAQDTSTGIRRARELMPDLIVTNCMLPDSDRFDLVRQIRQTNYLAHIPIIVSSDDHQSGDRRQSIEAGGNDFLCQPIDPSELLQKLQKYLQVQWIYQEKNLEAENIEEIDEESLIIPPSEEIEALYKLAFKGSFKKIQKRMEALKQENSQFTAFSQKVEQLARTFQEKELLEFLQHYRTTVES
jgi:CheY-like chemotaxis protein